MPGVTAWYGLLRIGKPKAGDTVVVSAASGAVGGASSGCLPGFTAAVPTVGFAYRSGEMRLRGARVGIRRLQSMYKSDDARDAFKAATPNGVDVVFARIGGAVFDMALARMNAFGRVALCGLIAGYNGQDIALQNVRSILVNRLTIEGFIVSEHVEAWPLALAELGRYVASGALKYREAISDQNRERAQGVHRPPAGRERWEANGEDVLACRVQFRQPTNRSVGRRWARKLEERDLAARSGCGQTGACGRWWAGEARGGSDDRPWAAAVRRAPCWRSRRRQFQASAGRRGGTIEEQRIIPMRLNVATVGSTSRSRPVLPISAIVSRTRST